MFSSQNEWDCGYCALGRAFRVSRARIYAADPTPLRPRGFSLAEMQDVASRLAGQHLPITRYRNPMPLANTAVDGILLIRRHGAPFGHWVFVRRGWIYDSDFAKRFAGRSYPRRDWILLAKLSTAATAATAATSTPSTTTTTAAATATAVAV